MQGALNLENFYLHPFPKKIVLVSKILLGSNLACLYQAQTEPSLDASTLNGEQSAFESTEHLSSLGNCGQPKAWDSDGALKKASGSGVTAAKEGSQNPQVFKKCLGD